MRWKDSGIPFTTHSSIFVYLYCIQQNQSSKRVWSHSCNQLRYFRSKEQLWSNFCKCLSERWITLTDNILRSFPLPFFHVPHLPFHALFISLHLLHCFLSPSSIIYTSFSICPRPPFPTLAIQLSWRTRVVLVPLNKLCPRLSYLKRRSAWQCPNTRETWCRSWRSFDRSFLSTNHRLATAASRSAVRRSLR